VSDAGAAARQADHGGDQKQHHRDKEDDFGDFDGGSGEAAKAQNAGFAGINLSIRRQSPIWLMILLSLQSCYEGSPSRPRGAIVGVRRFA
jgi:hypothetical protein